MGKAGFSFSWRSLTLQLFLVIILPLTVLLLVFTFGSQALHQQAMRSLVGERDELAIRTAARALEEQVRQQMNAMRLLSLQAEGVDTAGLPHLLAEAAFLQDDFDLGLAFFDGNGILESASDPGDLWQGLQGELAPLVTSLVQGNQPDQTTTHTLRNPQTGEAMVVILSVDQSGQRVTAGLYCRKAGAGCWGMTRLGA
jgi:hypothetical protein